MRIAFGSVNGKSFAFDDVSVSAGAQTGPGRPGSDASSRR